MAISPQSFPPRKRRPSAGAFISPKLSDVKLVNSLLSLTQEIQSLKPLQCLSKRSSASIVRKVKLLSVLFEEIICSTSASCYSQSAMLCFEEMYIVLQRIKTHIEDCSNGSRMWLLMQIESAANTFHELNVDLATLLDVFPVKELDLNDDVKEVVALVRKQCSETKSFVDPKDEALRREVLLLLHRIKREIVPDQSKLSDVFQKLGLSSSKTCKEETESLEEEIQNQNDEKQKSEVVALIGLVRYARCVLFGSSTPRSSSWRRLDSVETNIPSDFRCPITLELMRDPVVVSTGQTYDHESIGSWIAAGHNTCPKTGQTLAHTDLIPNKALKNLITMWCRNQRIPLETAGIDAGNEGGVTSKAALEATKMTVSFLINKLSSSPSMDDANGVVYELRVLAKTDSDSRACIAEAGAIPLLVRYLSSDVGSEVPNLQVNAVTTILNLSIMELNKTRIVETDGALNGVIEVLRSGATWEAKSNAAATIFCLSTVSWYRKRLGRKTRIIKGLMDLARDGPTWSKRDALVAILNLAADRETVGRLVEGGVIEILSQIFDDFPEEAVTILEAVVKRGGLVAVAAAYSIIKKLSVLLRDGSNKVREGAAATLVTLCRNGGSEMVVELATMPGIERIIWELSGTGTSRARRKAASLLRILRRWASGLDGGGTSTVYGNVSGSSTTTMVTSSTRTRMMLLS